MAGSKRILITGAGSGLGQGLALHFPSRDCRVIATDVTVNTICPAYIRTPLVDAQIRDQARAHGISEQEVIEKIMLRPMPKKAFIGVDEVAGSTEFLIGDAARNITGQTIVIDGGWTAA